MQTRAQFLASGLSPVDSIPAGASPECPICFREYDEPVHLPCHVTHVCCRDCIFAWLSAPGVNSCPHCRAVLFTLVAGLGDSDDDSEEEEITDSQQYQATIREARQISGLLPHHHNPRDAPTLLYIFGMPVPLHGELTDHAQEAAETMQGLYDHDETILGVGDWARAVGPGHVNCNALTIWLIVFGNFLPAFHEIREGRPYQPDQVASWRTIVATFAAYLRSLDNQPIPEVATGHTTLIDVLQGQLEDTVGRENEFGNLLDEFTRYGELNQFRDDLNRLVDSVAVLVRSERIWRDEQGLGV